MRKRKIKKAPVRNDTSTKKKKATVKKAKRAKKQLVPRTRNGGTFTEAQFFQKIRSSLRNGFRWWSPMTNCLRTHSRPSQSLNKRLKTEYQCNSCKQWFPRTQIEIDHVVPCGELNCYDDIVPFIKNLTQENESAFQLLCKHGCHKDKTDKEKLDRKNKKCNI